ncbi:Heat shock protein Hsp90 [Corchorus capsularis]|uniref:Heat shock protein Hsp90 n=1 Tax=Corchorus capsularis TaxID=210143 RepID=A0A1R3KY70_COCAP|nr:Heat shock protein Hsp90 [Corchorus capsularis]
MHRLSRRSVSAALRAPATRYRNAAAASVSSSTPLPDSAVGSDNKTRWYSAITGGKCNTARYSTQLNLKSGLVLGCRHESTAAASDSANPPLRPGEKYDNASDALDKLRYLSVTEPQLLKDAVDLDIRIQTDKDNGIISITDSGIGMTRQDLVDCLGTIAQSGTAKFLKAMKVVVSTKSPKSDKHYVWEGEANASSYTIREETDPENLIPRGTRLTLYLKRDDKGFAHPERIERLVKNYSQFVSFPIYTWQEKGITKEVEVDEDPVEAKEDAPDGNTEKKKKTKKIVERYWDWVLANETQPIWLRNPKEVTTEEYNEFYKKTFNEYADPLASSHFTTEGEVEFRSILYVPAVSPMGKDDIVNSKTKNIRLYVKRVFISDDFDGELFPRYLSFVKGVVDSNDLPLNVSREILQESRIVRIMRKRLVRKAFDMILGISMSENRGVLYLVDPIDEIAIQNLKSYKEKNFVDISKEDLDLGDKNEEKEKVMKEEFGQTCDWIRKHLGDKVASVQISNRLSSSPCVLVSGKFGWSANMERLMKAQAVGDSSSFEFMKGRKVFEINPEHPIIKEINAAYKSNPNDEDALRAIDLLYDAALVSSGYTPDNPAQLGGKIYEMMGIALSNKWSTPGAQNSVPPPPQPETLEAEVVEPVEAGGQK